MMKPLLLILSLTLLVPALASAQPLNSPQTVRVTVADEDNVASFVLHLHAGTFTTMPTTPPIATVAIPRPPKSPLSPGLYFLPLAALYALVPDSAKGTDLLSLWVFSQNAVDLSLTPVLATPFLVIPSPLARPLPPLSAVLIP